MPNQHSRMTDEEWFVDGIRRNGTQTRKRLTLSGVPDECSMQSCPNPKPVWAGKPLTLQIDHINGDRWDNRIENVRILCPNCHTQTVTYGNTGARKSRNYCDCGKEISRVSVRCQVCEGANRTGVYIIAWPSDEELFALVRAHGWSGAGRVIGSSDNGIRKYLSSRKIDFRGLKKYNP